MLGLPRFTGFTMYFLSRKLHRTLGTKLRVGASRKLGGLATTGGRAQSLRSLFRR
jgi:hypothetical protein